MLGSGSCRQCGGMSGRQSEGPNAGAGSACAGAGVEVQGLEQMGLRIMVQGKSRELRQSCG